MFRMVEFSDLPRARDADIVAFEIFRSDLGSLTIYIHARALYRKGFPGRTAWVLKAIGRSFAAKLHVRPAILRYRRSYVVQQIASPSSTFPRWLKPRLSTQRLIPFNASTESR